MPSKEETPTHPPFTSPGVAVGGFASPEPSTNDLGSTLRRTFHPMTERYAFDGCHCRPGDGWEQYDTDQDASYFGVWVRLATRETVTYAEGDITHVQAPDVETFRAELAAMAEFYGDPPPWAKAIDTDTGQVTHYPATRPGAELLEGSG